MRLKVRFRLRSPLGVRGGHSAHSFSQARSVANLTEIQKLQEEHGFWKAFPPEGTTVVSWYVMMGIGQVVTLEVPASKLRDVNVALEKTAWKAFRTEFYPTYDLYPLIRDKLANPAKKSP